jgi:thioester reductase-like protein
LSQEDYNEMKNAVTIIFHNAWRLDFNLSLVSFEPQLRATLNLINLATASPFVTPPKILNASSISVVSSHPTGWVKEEEPDPLNVAPTGYGQSKFVAECLLASVEGLPHVNARIGQLSGSHVNGSWNSTDWFPMILRSSETIKMLPAGDDALAWLPVDWAAKSMVDMAFNKRASGTVHLVHPRPITWAQMIDHMSQELGIPIVPFSQWIGEVAKIHDLIANPVGKMLEVYKRKPIGANEKGREAFGIPRAYCDRAAEFSAAHRNMPPLSRSDFNAWLSYWRSHKFLR